MRRALSSLVARTFAPRSGENLCGWRPFAASALLEKKKLLIIQPKTISVDEDLSEVRQTSAYALGVASVARERRRCAALPDASSARCPTTPGARSGREPPERRALATHPRARIHHPAPSLACARLAHNCPAAARHVATFSTRQARAPPKPSAATYFNKGTVEAIAAALASSSDLTGVFVNTRLNGAGGCKRTLSCLRCPPLSLRRP